MKMTVKGGGVSGVSRESSSVRLYPRSAWLELFRLPWVVQRLACSLAAGVTPSTPHLAFFQIFPRCIASSQQGCIVAHPLARLLFTGPCPAKLQTSAGWHPTVATQATFTISAASAQLIQPRDPIAVSLQLPSLALALFSPPAWLVLTKNQEESNEHVPCSPSIPYRQRFEPQPLGESTQIQASSYALLHNQLRGYRLYRAQGNHCELEARHWIKLSPIDWFCRCISRAQSASVASLHAFQAQNRSCSLT